MENKGLWEEITKEKIPEGRMYKKQFGIQD
jgi:hypothetical protein